MFPIKPKFNDFYKNLTKFVLSKMTKMTLFEIIEMIGLLVDTTK